MQEFYAEDHRRFARNGLAGKWGISLVVSLLAGILGGTGARVNLNSVLNRTDLHQSLSYYSYAWNEERFQTIIAIILIIYLIFLAWVIVGNGIRLGYCLYYIRLMRGKPPAVSCLFSRMRYVFKATGLAVEIGFFTSLWSLLFVIPGIIASYRYSQAFYIMAERPDVGIKEAINLSKQMMDGRKGRLFCLQLSFIGWAILAILSCGIGFLWLVPYQEAANASFYLDTAYNRFYFVSRPDSYE